MWPLMDHLLIEYFSIFLSLYNRTHYTTITVLRKQKKNVFERRQIARR